MNFIVRTVKTLANPMNEASMYELNIPYAPRLTSAKSKAIFNTLNTEFLIRINLVSLNEMNTLSIIEPRDETTMKKIKLKLKSKFSFMNNKLGENFPNPSKNTVERIIVIIVTSVKQVFISLFFAFELGKYLTSPVPKPNKEKEVIRLITERMVVASPTS